MSDNPAANREDPKAYVSVLIGDDEHRHLLVNSVRSQLQWSKTARAQGWDRDDQMLAPIFLAWWNGKRAGLWDLSWEDFSDRDDVFVAEDTAPEEDLDTDEDPSTATTYAE